LVLALANRSESPRVSKDSQILDSIPDDAVKRRYLMFPAGEALDEESLQRSALALLAVGGQDYNPPKEDPLEKIGKRLPKSIKTFLERGGSICAFIFPILELSTNLAGKALLSSDSPALRRFYSTYLVKLRMLYLNNVYLIFFGMIGIFITFSRQKNLSKFLRFNVIQAILMSIAVQCYGQFWPNVAFVFRESAVGVLISNSFFWGAVLTIFYCVGAITLGRYPKIPILSDAAKLNVLRD
jgi:hypothetical protein